MALVKTTGIWVNNRSDTESVAVFLAGNKMYYYLDIKGIPRFSKFKFSLAWEPDTYYKLGAPLNLMEWNDE